MSIFSATFGAVLATSPPYVGLDRVNNYIVDSTQFQTVTDYVRLNLLGFRPARRHFFSQSQIFLHYYLRKQRRFYQTAPALLVREQSENAIYPQFCVVDVVEARALSFTIIS
jgi:hypothetical protein